MPLPNVHYGTPTSKTRNFRDHASKFRAKDDDKELKKTPLSVVHMLGFDPKIFSKAKKQKESVNQNVDVPAARILGEEEDDDPFGVSEFDI